MSFKTTLLIIIKIWSNIIYEEKIKRLKINYRNTSEVIENVTVFNLIASNRDTGLHLDSKQSRLHRRGEIFKWNIDVIKVSQSGRGFLLVSLQGVW